MTTKLTPALLLASAPLIRLHGSERSRDLRVALVKTLALAGDQLVVFAKTTRTADAAELKQLRASIRKTMAAVGADASEILVSDDRVRFVVRASADQKISAADDEPVADPEIPNDNMRDPDQLTGPPEKTRGIEDYERDTVDLLTRQLKRAHQLIDSNELDAPDYLLDAVHIQLVQATRSMAAAIKILLFLGRPVTDSTDEKVEQVQKKVQQEIKKPVHTGADRRKSSRSASVSVSAAAIKLPEKFTALVELLDLVQGTEVLEDVAWAAEELQNAWQIDPAKLMEFVVSLPSYDKLKEAIADASLADEEAMEEMVDDLRNSGQDGTDDELLDVVLRMNESAALADLSEADYSKLIANLKTLVESAKGKTDGMRTAIQRARDRRKPASND